MTDIYTKSKNEAEKLYTESKDTIQKYTSNLPANTITIVIVAVLVLWVLIGFSSSFIILFLLLANVFSLYYLYEKNYITINT